MQQYMQLFLLHSEVLNQNLFDSYFAVSTTQQFSITTLRIWDYSFTRSIILS